MDAGIPRYRAKIGRALGPVADRLAQFAWTGCGRWRRHHRTMVTRGAGWAAYEPARLGGFARNVLHKDVSCKTPGSGGGLGLKRTSTVRIGHPARNRSTPACAAPRASRLCRCDPSVTTEAHRSKWRKSISANGANRQPGGSSLPTRDRRPPCRHPCGSSHTISKGRTARRAAFPASRGCGTRCWSSSRNAPSTPSRNRTRRCRGTGGLGERRTSEVTVTPTREHTRRTLR